jgi:glycosyltransferase involved in cell wall biosynthesis
LNILFISEPLFPVTATSSRTLNFAKAIADRGHNVHVLSLRESPNAPPEEFYDGYHIIRHGKDVFPVKFFRERVKTYINFLLRGKMLPFYAKMVNTANTYDIDILHCANYLPSLIGVTFRKFIRKPVVCDLQASVSLESYARGMYIESIAGKMVEKTTCECADAVIVPVPEYKEYLSKISGQNAKKCYVVPSCVKIDQFIPRLDTEIRSKLGLPLNNYLVFFHGSPYPENFKALELLVQIVDELNKNGLSTKALVAGNFGNKASNTKNIVFTGWLSQGDLAQYINAADIAILPVFTECKGISTRVVEYMASGKATITTKDGATGVGFAVKEGGLVTANTLTEIVDAASHLLRNESLRESIGKTARLITEKYLSPESVGLRLESVYDRILNCD